MSDNRVSVEVGEQDRELWKLAATRIRMAQALLELYGDPAPGSPLAADDENCMGDTHLSDAARGYLGAALDNLAMWANEVAPRIFIEGVPVENPPRPHFTLARGGLESAAQAAWILGPDDAEARLERHHRLAVADLDQMRLTVRHIDEAARTAVVDRIAAIRDLSATEIKPAPAYLDMVRDAAAVVGMVADDAEVLWRTASAAAHGKLWFIDATHETTIGEEFAAGRFRAVRTPDPGTVSAVVTFAADLAERVVLRFGQLLDAPLGEFIAASLQIVADDLPRAIPMPHEA